MMTMVPTTGELKREALGLDDIPWAVAGGPVQLGGRKLQVNVGRMSPAGNAFLDRQT